MRGWLLVSSRLTVAATQIEHDKAGRTFHGAPVMVISSVDAAAGPPMVKR